MVTGVATQLDGGTRTHQAGIHSPSGSGSTASVTTSKQTVTWQSTNTSMVTGSAPTARTRFRKVKNFYG